MKRITLSFAALVVALTATAQLEVKELKLSNGMTVWLNEDHSQPKVFGAVVVRAGAKDCPNTGIAHYFEHIMFKGTDRMGTIDYAAEKPLLDSISAQYDLLSQTKDDAERSSIQKKINELSIKAADFAIPNEFNRLISKYGGSGLNAGTGYDMTYYHNEFLPQFIEQWCWLNSERLMNPVYRADSKANLRMCTKKRTVRPMVRAMLWRKSWVLCSRLSLMHIQYLALLRV